MLRRRKRPLRELVLKDQYVRESERKRAREKRRPQQSSAAFTIFRFEGGLLHYSFVFIFQEQQMQQNLAFTLCDEETAHQPRLEL